MAMRVKKKKPAEIDRSLLCEPPMTAQDWEDYLEGWRLFNDGRFWHAHEAWEAVWRRHPEESRIFFQGIVQLTAACDLIVVKQRYGGAFANLRKSHQILALFPSPFLGIRPLALLEMIQSLRAEMERVGTDNLASFNHGVLPRVIPLAERSPVVAILTPE